MRYLQEQTDDEFISIAENIWNDIENSTHEYLPEKTNKLQQHLQKNLNRFSNKAIADTEIKSKVLNFLESILQSPIKINFEAKVNCSLMYVGLLITEGDTKLFNFILILEESIHNSSLQEPLFLSLLSIYSGTLIKLDSRLLSVIEPLSSKPLAIHILEKILCLSETLECVKLLALTRTLKQWSQKMNFLMKMGNNNAVSVLSPYEDLLKVSLEYLFLQMLNKIDAVRYTSKETFSDLVKIIFMLQTDSNKYNWKNNFLNYLQEQGKHNKAVYIALECALDIINTEHVILNWPNVIDDLLLMGITNRELSSYVSECIIKLSKNDDSLPEIWFERWIMPLSKFSSCAKTVKEGFINGILKSFLKSQPNSLRYILNLDPDILSSTTLLECLRVAKSIGIFPVFNPLISNDSDHNTESLLWKGVVPYSKIKSHLFHSPSKHRVSCFTFLCESHKTTELFSRSELNLILAFIKEMCLSQSPSIRQEVLSLFKKCILRCKDGGMLISRVNKKRKEAKLEAVLQYHNEFLLDITYLSLKNLFPGSNFCRRHTSLKLLEIINDCIGFRSDIYPLWEIINDEIFNTLLNCLYEDSYEVNKKIAADLIAAFLEQNIPCPVPVEDIKSTAISLAQSLKPSLTVSAFYFAKVAVAYSKYEINSTTGETKLSEPDPITSFIFTLVEVLDSHLKIAKTNLLQAACLAPMYGIISLVHNLMKEISIDTYGCNYAWKPMLKRLEKLCVEACFAVWPIICSVSPEGLVPHEIDQSTLSLLKKAFDVPITQQDNLLPTNKARAFASQMLLLCCWRTAKEASLFLGFLSRLIESCLPKNLYPVDSDMAIIRNPFNSIHLEEDQTLSFRDIIVIGNHLVHLLSEVKHRGAFEQTYVGFCQYVSQLWNSGNTFLKTIPLYWLKEILKSLEDISVNLSCTRRSAGLPFLIQGLLSTNPNLKYCDSVKETFSTLFSYTNSDNETPLDVKVHAIHIMRSLFKDTRLRDVSSVYLAEAVIISVEGFKSKSWDERNASTLLFSVLFTKLFGVKHGIDEQANTLTGNALFRCHPLLYSYFLKELATMSNHSTPLSLYPILLILSKLYPSSYEGIKSDFKLNSFHKPLLSCADNKNYRIRELSSQAIASLVMKEDYEEVLQLSFIQIKNYFTTMNFNGFHGALLQISSILRVFLKLEKEESKIFNIISDLQTYLLTLLSSEMPCFIFAETFKLFNIFLINQQICEKHIDTLKLILWHRLQSVRYKVNHGLLGVELWNFLGFVFNFACSLVDDVFF